MSITTIHQQPYSADNEDEWINGIQDENENHETNFTQRRIVQKKRNAESSIGNLDARERRIIQRRLWTIL